jgi:hypothetical protein
VAEVCLLKAFAIRAVTEVDELAEELLEDAQLPETVGWDAHRRVLW